MQAQKTDFLVIGSGLAGLHFALQAADHGWVTIVTKGSADEATTARAQGGIAAVTGSPDTFAEHVRDTLEAGIGLCHEAVVRQVIHDAPQCIEDLVRRGVQFTREEEKKFALAREGGHSRARILYAKDATGLAIHSALLKRCRQNPNIQILENSMACDLAMARHLKNKNRPNACYGAYVLNTRTNEISAVAAKTTLLATGGARKVYRYTSNPDAATGDGIALAWRAGSAVKNMEFVQFHPTCLYSPTAKNFLISEAVRGEGAVLKRMNGEPFMHHYDLKKELATRDVVARAIDFELKKSGDPYVLLDISHKPADVIRERFPNIYKKCLEIGIDITREPIPVVPAAHYFCGGVPTDLHAQTSIANLYAAGEVAHTGLHGANRLASNSLLETTAFATYAARHAVQKIAAISTVEEIVPWDSRNATDLDEEVVITQNWDEIRAFMWNFVGIVRSDKRLDRALRRIQLLQKEIDEYYWNFKLNQNLLELRNLSIVANLVIRSALSRKESRGLHYNSDYPKMNAAKGDTVLR